MTDNELFDGKCPYTDQPCFYEWDCANCDVETEERLWADDCDGDCEHCEWATCPKMEANDEDSN